MPTLRSTGQKLAKFVEKKGAQSVRDFFFEGQLVEVENENGVTSVNVLDEDGNKLFNRMWCLLKGETNPTQVWAWVVSPYPDLPVWLFDFGQGYEVFRAKSLEGTFLENEALQSVSFGPLFNEVNKFTLVDRNYQPGMVIKSPQGGLWIQVYAVRYVRKDGSAETLMPQELDLTPYLPSTSGTWSWVLVCIDPVTNALTAVTGDEYAGPALLTRDLLDDIDTAGLIPLDAVKLADSSTEITGENEFAFGRAILQHWPKNNYDATTAPTSTDDDSEGYEIGSVWVDTVASVWYSCVDATTNAAVWVSSSATTFYQTVEDNSTPLTQRGSLNLIEGGNVTLTIIDNPGNDSTDITIAAAGTGGVTPVGTLWEPRAAPASPSASDSEFAAASGGVPTGFTEVDFGANTTVAENTYGLLMTQTTHAGNSVAGIYRAIPDANFSMWTRVSQLAPFVTTAGGTAFKPGLTLYEDATDSAADILTWHLDLGAPSTIGWQLITYTAYNGTATSLSAGNGSFATGLANAFMRIRFDGTTYYFELSHDGISIVRPAVLTAAALGWTPTHMGLSVNNLNTGTTASGLFQFFRYAGSDVGVVPMNGRRVTYFA